MVEKAEFDWVVSNVSHHCDALITQPGLDSFLLWSSKPDAGLFRRSPLLLTDWPITMPEDRQRKAVAKLDRSSRICAAYDKKLSDWWTDSLSQSTRAELANLSLVAYVQQLAPIRKVGDYEIRGNPAVQAIWKDDFLLDGVRDVDGKRSAVGVPVDLLSSANAELVFGFEAAGSGPLVSVQQRNTNSDEQTYITEPLAYISRTGSLVVRGEAMVRAKLAPQASVIDGRWHEFALRHDYDGWTVSLDGLERGRLAEFLTAANTPRYLQVGPTFVENCLDLGRGWKSFPGSLRDVRVRNSDLPLLSAARSAR